MQALSKCLSHALQVHVLEIGKCTISACREALLKEACQASICVCALTCMNDVLLLLSITASPYGQILPHQLSFPVVLMFWWNGGPLWVCCRVMLAAHPRLRASALLALTKLMVVNPSFCDANLQLFFTLLQSRSVPAHLSEQSSSCLLQMGTDAGSHCSVGLQ